MAICGTIIEPITADGFETHLEELAALLNACVADGASVSFVLPHTTKDSQKFWIQKVYPGVANDERVLLVAKAAGKVVAAVQLDCDMPQNQPHRAEVEKLLVDPDFRERGIARALMCEIEDYARRRSRSLITLDTASCNAEKLYLSMGFERVGIIPGFARDPIDDRYDPTTIMFKVL